jgi:hypothetical protein
MNINPLGTKNKIVTAGLVIFLKAKENPGMKTNIDKNKISALNLKLNEYE